MADPCTYSKLTNIVARHYGGGYSNTSKDRIKDTLAKAQFLIDDPFNNEP